MSWRNVAYDGWDQEGFRAYEICTETDRLPDFRVWTAEPKRQIPGLSGRLRELWEVTGGRCWYCGIQTVPAATQEGTEDPGKSFTADHFIPHSKGGKNWLNLVPCCKSCNSRKNNRTIEWLREKNEGKPFYFEEQGFLAPYAYRVRKTA